jgi:F-type H+-transporting ATPase subunit b
MRCALLAASILLVAAPAYASGDEGGGLMTMFWQAFNLVLIVGIIVYFARKPVAEYMEQRRQGIQQDLENSAKLLSDAEGKLAEWNARAERLDAELGKIRETSRRLAEEERDAILAQAEAGAQRIRSDATAAVDQELRRARDTLSAEAAELAVDLAAKLVAAKVTPQDQGRLFDEFLSRIEAGPPGSGDGR